MSSRLTVLLLSSVMAWQCCGAPAGQEPTKRVVHDRDHDGRPDLVLTYRGGKLVRLEADEDFDGLMEEVKEIAYYADGRQKQMVHAKDRNRDGHLDTWYYYKDGAHKMYKRGIDVDKNGAPDRWFFYGADGKTVLHTDLDWTGDGVADERIYYKDRKASRREYLGQHETAARDGNGDGKPDRWSYGRDGAVVREELDLDADGTPDVRYWLRDGAVRLEETLKRGRPVLYTWHFRKQGRLVRTESDTYPFPKRGHPLKKRFFEAGELKREEIDRDRDGRPDAVSVFAKGKLIEERRDEDLDGNTETWKKFVYDDKGTLVALVDCRDSNHDGRPDCWIHYDGRTRKAVKAEHDANQDGRIERWDWYEDGAVVRTDVDTDGDGKADRRVHYRRGRAVRTEILEP